MDPRAARTELDRATGRRATRSDRRTRPQRRERRERRRGAPVAAALLIAALAAAWLFVSGRGSGSGAVPPLAEAPATAPATRAVANTAALRAALHAPATCTDVAAADPEVACSINGVRVDARLLGAARASNEYATAAGKRSPPATGPSACANGKPDERAWSRPANPSVPAGRYRCRVEDGVAAMWWTDEGVLVHATAATPDLGALFAWWRTHLAT